MHQTVRAFQQVQSHEFFSVRCVKQEMEGIHQVDDETLLVARWFIIIWWSKTQWLVYYYGI